MHTGASLMGRASRVLLPLFVTSASVHRAPMAQTKWLAGIWCNLHLTTKSWRLFLWSRCWWVQWRRSWLCWTAGNGVCDPHTSKVAARMFLPNGDRKSSLFSFPFFFWSDSQLFNLRLRVSLTMWSHLRHIIKLNHGFRDYHSIIWKSPGMIPARLP